MLSNPKVSPSVYPCLATDGAPLSWHGHFGAGALGEGPLASLIHRLADDGSDFEGCKEDGVKAVLLIQLKSYIMSHVQERMQYSSLSHLLPTWDVGKNPVFSPLF